MIARSSCCGTGIGVCIAANKVPGIRAALTHDTYSAKAATVEQRPDHHHGRPGHRTTELAKDIAGAFLRETFDEKGRSADNVRAINEVDAKYNRLTRISL
jgi:ribose 5-phosphate isomerase RpiB